ncbi:MAG: thiamine pyrophosphate-dependent enzyme [Bacteroidota bacterium]|nr:thiamine pyrophosphate-dependent enzyme [Bacteroidota bacterium]MDP4233267.1 thiamine pyrophosphate-dependent enzyme [Bacteroidota bacterium]MDP4242113.1 thiamine pyrophosphate-dependent enzyme [Bacteroidota bacterium]MDP4288608.1 thiamine pyrophosphate-dependent enzyme [Bacteroidota bacterium]
MDLGRITDVAAANYLKKAMGWSYHAPCAGHEGIQLAIGQSFRQKKDYLFPYYRDLMTCLSAGMTVEEIVLNGLSKATDIAGGGRHMSNHFAKMSIGIQNGSSLTNNHAQHVAGCARAIKYYKLGAVAIFSGGESGTSEGFFYEAVNGATREKVPAIFVIQNNKYGISVPVTDQSANTRVADNFRGFDNLLITYCDGTDMLDSYRAMQEAYEWCLSGRGAAMVHADCVRIGSHSNSDRHDLYRSPEELEAVKLRDPLIRLRDWLVQNEIATVEELHTIHADNQKIFNESSTKAEGAPSPDASTVLEYLLAPDTIVSPAPHEFQADDIDVKFYPFTIPSGKDEGMQFIEGINRTLKEEFHLNANTFLWGQDVASKNKGGVFNVTKGMLQEFGNQRVFNGPIAEDFILGSADGFCRVDQEHIWCVVEGAEFADYFWPAMESFVELTHEAWRTRGQYMPNIMIRLASGGYIGGGLYHSQNLEGTFTTIPGIRIVIPSFADDAQGLVRTALRTRGITMFLEPKVLYYHPKAKANSLADNELVPFGKARLRREGSDLSIITYGTTTHFSLQAAEELAKDQGIQCDVLDLRSLYPLDLNAILKSVEKTGRALVVHEDKVTGGFGGEIGSLITEHAFQSLDAPVQRVGSLFTPVGFAKVLEDATLPNPAKIKAAAERLAKW